MERCIRCCLRKAMRIINVVLNLCGIGMIIYCLWLLKKWSDGIAELHSHTKPFKPWFIDTCLGVGIAVCLSTLLGHMVANCISNSYLCIYVISCCCLLLLQIGVIVAILYKIDWTSIIAKYIDDSDKKFKSFANFHLTMCRLIAVIAVVAQINVVALAVILWSMGIEPERHYHNLDPPDFAQSFLVAPNSPRHDRLIEACTKCEDLDGVNPRQSFLSYIKSVFRLQLLRRITSS